MTESNKSSYEGEKITAKELMNVCMFMPCFSDLFLIQGLLTPFPRFIALNSDTPDLSIPQLEARVQKENNLSLKGMIAFNL